MPVQRFRKKPIIIEALHLIGADAGFELLKFCPYHFRDDQDGGYIQTLEGKMSISKGDWVIKGINGEYYPCKPDIFEKTYELVED